MEFLVSKFARVGWKRAASQLSWVVPDAEIPGSCSTQHRISDGIKPKEDSSVLNLTDGDTDNSPEGLPTGGQAI